MDSALEALPVGKGLRLMRGVGEPSLLGAAKAVTVALGKGDADAERALDGVTVGRTLRLPGGEGELPLLGVASTVV